MNVLAIETSGEVCSVAVLAQNASPSAISMGDPSPTLPSERGGSGSYNQQALTQRHVGPSLCTEVRFAHEMHLSERLMGDIDSCLREAGLALHQLGGIAVGVGPGSFTGLRIGVTTAKTLAWSLELPIVGVDALEALLSEVDDERVVAVVRALPGRVYARVRTGQSVLEPEMMACTDLAARLLEPGHAEWTVVGDGSAGFAKACAGIPELSLTFGSADAPTSATIAKIGIARLKAGRGINPIALEPMYIAPPPIDPRAERKV